MSIDCEVCGCRFNKGKARGFRTGGGICPGCAKKWLKQGIADVLMCSARGLEPFARRMITARASKCR